MDPTLGERQDDQAQKQRGSGTINNINRLANLRNPLGFKGFGARVAVQAVSRGFTAFLFNNPWVWAIFAIILIFIFTLIIVESGFGGAGGFAGIIPDGNPCWLPKYNSRCACVERGDCAWVGEPAEGFEGCVSIEEIADPSVCPPSRAHWYHGQCETDACNPLPGVDIIWDNTCSGKKESICDDDSLMTLFDDSCKEGGSLTGAKCCPKKIPGSVCVNVPEPQGCTSGGFQSGFYCTIPPAEP